MASTAEHFGFSAPALPDLAEYLPSLPLSERVKCSITYHESIESVTCTAYTPKRIGTLKVIEVGRGLDYQYKRADRTKLQELHEQRGSCDEVLIAQEGFITDTTYSNVVFERNGALFTPTTYLLNGTKRQRLLESGEIVEVPITVSDLHLYDKIYLINAMLELSDGVALSTSSIY